MASTAHVLIAGFALRAAFFLFGLYQDSHMTVKYTDIDYVVFSDAANFVYQGKSPYLRETYRYTPLLAWMLVPNAWGGMWVHFGKVLFVMCDILTGVLIARNLPGKTVEKPAFFNKRAVLSAIWVLNPMVITISTRGSSESVLTFIIMLSVDTLLRDSYTEAAFWLGLAIHFKIYPVIYLPAFMYYLVLKGRPFGPLKNVPVLKWLNGTNVRFLILTLSSVAFWNWIMYSIYGPEFLYHSYYYHLTRLDHRHNFSVYNISLYYSSAKSILTSGNVGWAEVAQVWTDNIEKIAFVPQLVLSAVILPLRFAQSNLVACLFMQTFAFVTFNKVMTSQYFVWFLIFLPHYLASSRLCTKKHALRGLTMLFLWVISQACWLYFAYKLEFLGESTFDSGLLYSSIFFFLTNCWMLGQFIQWV
ncbi:Mannosyltransferase (PIG-M) family protein [Clavispora lusitaniae]|uniref:Mannosyltransferase (PIG-M) family protein n=1 Tax=Clavispora lusitaniae TaxID=36911 RepID=UPI00202C2048|nr:Mannosyltransferase (PIG-M) family protein [Clavispora lusitaniae]